MIKIRFIILPAYSSFLFLIVIMMMILSISSSALAVTNQTNSSSLVSKQQQQQQHITKVKITSPTKGQEVPVGKDLTVSGTSIANATSNCHVSVIVNKVRPYQPANPSGTAAAGDYSKWSFILTSKYTTIKPGQNRITAKYDCPNNPALNSFSSVNVTGAPAISLATKAVTNQTKISSPQLSGSANQTANTTTRTETPFAGFPP